ncbi:MAG: 3' terminal RNA ribose 2'-O-methyltransferase Hen1 [Spirochaetaceae bacterium]|jgi:3' terminal RNA ribose 2'-O-methyltransferase Hen1|nr:3' terminal RNA ribose 2'-O-methyltransferase Hen1 [Spirochaetaceae bacterium]
MLLTISYAGENALDLGYLLHKNPRRPQKFALNFGNAYVFYPETSETRCTAALLLDIDPLDLARGKLGAQNGRLFDYVNDRPYSSTSFMSVALTRVFGTAMSGRCAQRQALADSPLDLTVTLYVLPCRGNTGLLRAIFEPLGYEVTFDPYRYDEGFPEWGDSPYVDLTLRGTVRLQDLLRHLYVLIPVFDRSKHYYMAENEIDKLLHNGEGWLDEHPKKALIIRRYFHRVARFNRIALERLDAERETEEVSYLEKEADSKDSKDSKKISDSEKIYASEEGAEETPVQPNLNALRLETAVQVLKDCGASSVLDAGCGEGSLLRLLMKEKRFAKIAGADVSVFALERAGIRLKLDQLPEIQKNRISLFQSSIVYRDSRFAGYDAIAALEVIEHLEENRIPDFSAVIFGEAKPKTVIVTTPNREYNKNYPGLQNGQLRHSDHRFEWTRTEFREWAEKTALRYGYRVACKGIGEPDETAGSPTQMGVFTGA